MRLYKKIPVFVAFVVMLLTGCSPNGMNQPARGMATLPTQPLPMATGPMPAHIALLLPTSGPLAAQTAAIRNGFFAAYYKNKLSDQSPPTIKVYDTSHENITTVYAQAVAEGAQFVVGPLIKADIAALVNARAISVPTLALNTIDGNVSRTNRLYQFGLSPLDEAVQAAEKIKQDGRHRVIILMMTNELGKRIADAFEKTWRDNGGSVVEKFSFNNIFDLNNGIPKLLNIDASQHRAKLLQSAIRAKIRVEPYRRHDFDAIFLAATPNQARQVLPLLRFYYAGNVPVYATSSVYAGKPGTPTDYDLNGIIFDDMPWVVTASQLPSHLTDIQQNIQQLWPDSYEHLARLYALGVDAYQVIPNLDHLSTSPQQSMMGATGQLYLLPNQHIYRQLDWAKMINGTPAAQSPHE